MKKIIYTLIVTLLAVGCNDDYLDLAPNGDMSEATFWKSEKDADLALTGCYRGWEGWSNILFFDGASDNGYEQYNYGAKKLGNGSLTPTDGTGTWTDGNSGKWFTYYRIRKYNDFLARIDNIEMDEAKKARYKAEVRFLRAYDYFNKVIHYGDMPLVTEVITDINKAALSRTPKEEVTKFIFDELDAIISGEALPIQNVIDSKGHVTKGAALALKARFKLYLGEYEKAQEAAAKVIDMSCYKLFQNGYDKLFLEESEGSNKEAILSIQFVPDKYNNIASLTCLPNSQGGWAALQASWDLVKAYESIDGTPFNEDKPFENKDPRLAMTILYPGAPYYGDYFDPFSGPDKSSAPINCPTRMPVRKYVEPYTDAWNQSGDFMVFRLAEMYLTFAECALYTGKDQDKALEYINMIRSRNSVDMPPKVNLTEEVVRNERRIELAFEGLRYFDIKRWDIGEEALNGPVLGTRLGSVDHTTGEVTWEGDRIIVEQRDFNPERNYLLPIPQSEIDLNPNITQNPGYN
ncbi:RagB/SusD family nutrient uptake outer membrane protein [Marinilabilia rubra]|uniref:RagB/SusD family nutrient uptake outer membrane protein n=1 Tax=Marinilabilia rubra TaxID=2162893 RepID=A0A2U2B5H9_9BACT|nr:RagB/SusD family nutrient uptake outer membrane protein [Marinilabilia rubra]PWD98302.1 RagB/SusD family nutrient uptake outer membrane protein [Marinilabilia rubra]